MLISKKMDQTPHETLTNLFGISLAKIFNIQ